MEQELQLRLKTEKMIYNLEEPEEIKVLIYSIFKDYDDVISSFIDRISEEAENDNKMKKIIEKIENHVKSDRIDNTSISDNIRMAEFDYRKNLLTKAIFSTMESIDKKKKEDEEINLDEGKMYGEAIKSNKRNMQYQKEIKENLISDLKSSTNYILNLVKDFKSTHPNIDLINSQLEDEMNLLMNNATLKLYQIKDVLDRQDEEIFNEFMIVLQEYKETVKNSEERKKEEKKSSIQKLKVQDTEEITKSEDKRSLFKSILSDDGKIRIDESKAKSEADNKKTAKQRILEQLGVEDFEEDDHDDRDEE